MMMRFSSIVASISCVAILLLMVAEKGHAFATTTSTRPEISSPMNFMGLINMASTVSIMDNYYSIASSLNEQNELMVERLDHVNLLLFVLEATVGHKDLTQTPISEKLAVMPDEYSSSHNKLDDTSTHVYASHIQNSMEFLCLTNQLEQPIAAHDNLEQLDAFYNTLQEQQTLLEGRLKVLNELQFVGPKDNNNDDDDGISERDVSSLMGSVQSVLQEEQQQQQEQLFDEPTTTTEAN